MHFLKKRNLLKLQLLLLIAFIFCAPLTMKAYVLDSAIALAPANGVLVAGVLLTLIGLLRFKRKQQQEEE